MGYTRKKICSHSGCNDYALPDSAYCEAHQKTVNRNTTSKFAYLYNSSWWRTARQKFLQSHIWCENCLKQGKHTPATVVHHTQGYKDIATFRDRSKWVGWCASCHSAYHTTITNEELYEKYKDRW